MLSHSISVYWFWANQSQHRSRKRVADWPVAEQCVTLSWLSKIIRGFPTRMVYLHYISCLRYTILVGIPRNATACFVGCLTSQQHASVSQGRICSDKLTYCHTETEVADPTFHLTQSQYTDTRPTSPSADPITPGAWQGSHWSANF